MVLNKFLKNIFLVFGGLFLASCASGTLSSGHLPPEKAPLALYVETFSNLTTTPDAGKSVTSMLKSELMRHPQFRMVPEDALPVPFPQGASSTNLSAALRDRLHASGIGAVLSGEVIEYAYRSELESEPVVGMNWTMTDLATGQVMWSVSLSGVGGCFLGCRQTLTSLSGKLIAKEVSRFVSP